MTKIKVRSKIICTSNKKIGGEVTKKSKKLEDPLPSSHHSFCLLFSVLGAQRISLYQYGDGWEI